MKCLGLDLGSTSIKGAVLDLERGEIGPPISRPFPAPLAGIPAGRVEISLDAIEVEVRQLLDQLLGQVPSVRSAPVGLFCSGQMGGLVLVDPAGKALSHYLSWRDQRTLEPHGDSATYLEAIRARWTGSELTELGSELQPGSASSLLFWLAENDLLPPGAMPATVADAILARLCHTWPSMDPTQAIGLLNLHTGDWHREAFAALGLECVRWPEIAEAKKPASLRGADLGAMKLVCHAAFGDQQCALRGVGLTRDELSLNISTGSQVSRRTAQFQPGPYQSRCYFDGEFLNTITHLPAGRSLNVLCDLLQDLAQSQGITLANPWERIAERAGAADGGGLHVDLSFFAGALGNQGRIEGITTENLTVGNLFFAAFRSMAENYAVCAERLCPDHAELRLALSGGLPRSAPILRRLIQERFGRPLRESAATEETLLGLLDVARSVYLPEPGGAK